MSDSYADRFNKFYKDFYAGRIDFGDYRYRRGLILDSIVTKPEPSADDLETLPRDAKKSELQPELQPELVPPPPLPPLEAPIEEKPEPAGKKTSIGIPAVLAISVIVVVAVIYFVLKQISRPETDLSALTPRTEAEAVPDLATQMEEEQDHEVTEATLSPPEPGQLLVESFVADPDWRRMSVQELQDSWARLSAADRIVAKGAVWFQPLADLLRDQIDEAQAIAIDPESDPQLDMLYELSLRLGMVEMVPPGWTPKQQVPEPGLVAAAPVIVVEDTPAVVVVPADKEPVRTIEPAKAPTEDPAPAATVEAAPVEKEPAPKSRHECSAQQLKTRRRNCYDSVGGDQSGPLMKILPAGQVVLGDGSDAAPQRTEVIVMPFAISIFEVTQAQFELFCQETGRSCEPPEWQGSEMPVVNVSKIDAIAYCDWLSKSTGHTYRLPTEAEWEYSARAGTTTTYPFGDKLLPAQARYSSVNNYDDPLPTSDDTTQRNKFGLWHVVGNVAEWIGDDVDGNVGIVRGGSFTSRSDECTSASRKLMNSNEKDNTVGIRVLREL
jgi:hypothetical protein